MQTSHFEANYLETWEKYGDYFQEKEDFERGGKAPNRPRSKKRPIPKEVRTAFVKEVARGRFYLETNAGEECIGKTAREIGAKKPVVGDIVEFIPSSLDLLQIVNIKKRKNELARFAYDGSQEKKTICANFDTLFILESLDNKKFSVNFIERIAASVKDENARIVIGITKCDLEDKYNVKDNIYKAFSQSLKSKSLKSKEAQNFQIAEFGRGKLADKVINIDFKGVSVFMGHSGVGKSTLLNQLLPQANQKTAEVSESSNQGRHTTSAAKAFKYGNGWIIDTPGIRSFGI
ncbi:MAG: ribosome small subunit-dependent GTPase A [Bifidobacteriaceae bacterium]|jgi:ribosome biogenesis GTPase|nr:ribosome small subunit-dependent GTPase A [Bifidobacteriaceae bacterium]